MENSHHLARGNKIIDINYFIFATRTARATAAEITSLFISFDANIDINERKRFQSFPE